MRRARLVCLVALVAALLAGCGGTPTPRFAPPATTAPSDPATTAAADPLPPVMPDAAKEHTVAGAKAFVKFVVATMNYSETTVDEVPLKPLFSEACYVCQSAPDTIAGIRRRHGVIAGGVISASRLRAVRLSAGSSHLTRVTFSYHSTRQTIRYPSGRRTIYKDGSTQVAWTLSERPGSWLVVGWDQP